MTHVTCGTGIGFSVEFQHFALSDFIADFIVIKIFLVFIDGLNEAEFLCSICQTEYKVKNVSKLSQFSRILIFCSFAENL